MSDTPKNKIKYGLKNVHYAVATIADDGSATYGTPVRIPGAVNLSLEPQGDRDPFYADDVEYFVSISNTGYEGDLGIALVPESFEKDVLKAIEDTKNVLFEEVSPEIVHFALLFQFAADKKNIRHCFYNCTAMRPTVEGETKGENIEPKLSSVQPDFIGEGRLAAELLEAMMNGRSIPAKKRENRVGIRAVVHRESTVPQSESGKFVQKVLAYISKEALRGIGVEDVARRFKVSRSLLELRFRELQGESVYEAMLRVRLDEVKRRLRHTSDTISEITSACGWKNATPPKILFKKRFGLSMRDYRAQGHA